MIPGHLVDVLGIGTCLGFGLYLAAQWLTTGRRR